MKKYEQINHFLEKIRAKNEKAIVGMRWQDLLTVPELRGIGKRTLRNILKEFKLKYGLMPKKNPSILKIEAVQNYISNLYDTLPEEEFYAINSSDLLKAPVLSGIGRTTILTSFARFILRHPPNTMRYLPDRIQNELVQEVCRNIVNNMPKIQRTLGLKQYQVAEQIGISNTTVNLIANGKRFPNMVFLYQMHRVLNVSINSFLFNDGPLFTDPELIQEHEYQRLVESVDSLNKQVRTLKRKIDTMSNGK